MPWLLEDEGRVGSRTTGSRNSTHTPAKSQASILAQLGCSFCAQWVDNQGTMSASLEAAAQHHRQGRLDQAAHGYHAVLARDSRNADALHLLGVIAHQRGEHAQAIELISRAVAINSAAAPFHHNLAEACRASGDPESALAHYQKAIQLRPTYADAFNNLGRAIEMLGRPGEARAMYRRAVAIDPLHAKAHFNVGLSALLLGEFEEGWREYEWRWRVDDYGSPKCPPGLPRWDGSDPADKRILVHCEQGFGDCIQFARYLPLLVGRGADIVLSCPAALARLFSVLPGVCVIADTDPPPTVDCCVAIASLPLHFATTPATIPTYAAYLRADKRLMDQWRQRLQPLRTDGQRLVGLAWAGNPAQAEDRWRSLHLSDLVPLADVPGVRFVSLQKGPAAEQLTTSPNPIDLIDLAPHLHDFADTAAVVSQLDLVIATDTSVAHLAGAVGKSAWTLVRFACDWRWGLTGNDTAWYPSMRLFRQASRGDWSPVIRDIAQCLSTLRPPASRNRLAA
jgi:Flp pilus assembly protein TadD